MAKSYNTAEQLTDDGVPEPLQFRVRHGLVLNRRRLVKRSNGHKTFSEFQVESFYPDDGGRNLVELTDAEVKIYAHCLEPTNARSAAALEALHWRPPARETEISYEQQLISKVVSATVQALVAAGMLKAPKAN